MIINKFSELTEAELLDVSGGSNDGIFIGVGEAIGDVAGFVTGSGFRYAVNYGASHYGFGR